MSFLNVLAGALSFTPSYTDAFTPLSYITEAYSVSFTNMLLDDDSRWVRLVLRVYFNVIFVVIALVGDRCVVYSGKLLILRKGSVKALRLTSWLKSFDPVLVLLKTRRLPAGWLGGLMILCAAFAFVSDVAVSSLVRSVQVSTRCPFTTGLVSPTTDVLSVIPVNGSPYTVALNARLNSIANGGTMGIYGKVDEDRNFQAQPQDIEGSWVCTDQEQDQVYQLGTTSDSIVNDLVDKTLLFNTPPYSHLSGINASFSHFVIVTSSQPTNTAQQPFDVRASIQQEALTAAPKTMRSYACSMNAPGLEWVLANASSQTILAQWSLTFQGAMYNGTGTSAAANAADRLQLILNAMVMVGAGGNYLLGVAPLGATQGCLVAQTDVPGAMIAIFVVVSVVFVALPVWLLVLLVRYYRFSTATRRRVIRDTPHGLVEWMVQAARATVEGGNKDDDNGTASGTVSASELRWWRFGFQDEDETVNDGGGGGGGARPRMFRTGLVSGAEHAVEEGILLRERGRQGVTQAG